MCTRQSVILIIGLVIAVVANEQSGMGNLLPEPSQYQCGQQIFTDRIIGGKDTQLGEFPWLALLEYENSLGIRKFVCGGSLINSRYVLTSAHCLVGPIERKIGKLIIVRLGEHNVDTQEDCVLDIGQEICSDPVQDISVESIIPHPDYVPNDMNQYHDIGLVRLRQMATYTNFIYPICLPSAHLRTETGHKLVVAGWRYRSVTGEKSSVKQQVSVPVVDQQECYNLYRDKLTRIQDKQLCAGGELNRGTCNGPLESGGPLMSLNNGLWYAEGLLSFGLSFGSGCGKVGWPEIYTRVTQYLDWIRSNVNP